MMVSMGKNSNFSQNFLSNQYKRLYTISNNIEVWGASVPHRAVKFQAGEENRIVYESMYSYN